MRKCLQRGISAPVYVGRISAPVTFQCVRVIHHVVLNAPLVKPLQQPLPSLSHQSTRDMAAPSKKQANVAQTVASEEERAKTMGIQVEQVKYLDPSSLEYQSQIAPAVTDTIALQLSRHTALGDLVNLLLTAESASEILNSEKGKRLADAVVKYWGDSELPKKPVMELQMKHGKNEVVSGEPQ